MGFIRKAMRKALYETVASYGTVGQALARRWFPDIHSAMGGHAVSWSSRGNEQQGSSSVGGGPKTFSARVKVASPAWPDGEWRVVHIQADDSFSAEQLLQAQYGVGAVSLVREVR